MTILHFHLQPQFRCMNYFIYTLHHTWWSFKLDKILTNTSDANLRPLPTSSRGIRFYNFGLPCIQEELVSINLIQFMNFSTAHEDSYKRKL